MTGLPERANVEKTVEHSDALALGVTLRSPRGTPSVLNPPFNAVLAGNSGLQGSRRRRNAFYAECPNGARSVKVLEGPEPCDRRTCTISACTGATSASRLPSITRPSAQP